MTSRRVEHRADHARLAVVQRAHAVEGVDGVARAGVDGVDRLVVGGVGVGDRGHRADRARSRRSTSQRARELGGERDHPHRAGGGERLELGGVRVAQRGGVLRAAPQLVQPRALEVGAEDHRVVGWRRCRATARASTSAGAVTRGGEQRRRAAARRGSARRRAHSSGSPLMKCAPPPPWTCRSTKPGAMTWPARSRVSRGRRRRARCRPPRSRAAARSPPSRARSSTGVSTRAGEDEVGHSCPRGERGAVAARVGARARRATSGGAGVNVSRSPSAAASGAEQRVARGGEPAADDDPLGVHDDRVGREAGRQRVDRLAPHRVVARRSRRGPGGPARRSIAPAEASASTHPRAPQPHSGPSGHDDHVAQLAARAVRASVRAAAEHDGRADAGAERDQQPVAAAARRAQLALRERGRAHVVRDRDRQPERPRAGARAARRRASRG